MKKMIFPREFYLPKSDTLSKYEYPHVAAVAYFYEVGDVPYSIGFSGKANAPRFHHRYRSVTERAVALVKWIEGLEKSAAFKAKMKEERVNAPVKLAAGDVLVSSWGYEQTNVDFYQVVEVKGKTATVVAIGQTIEQNGFMSGNVKPQKDVFCGEFFKKVICNGDSIKVKDHYARKTDWDKAHYSSWYA
jgi:hypothetical protein